MAGSNGADAADEGTPSRGWLDPRVLLVLALMGGTGLGGGVSTLVGGGTGRELADLRTEIALLRGAVEASTSSGAVERARLQRHVDDHEGRLRTLERAQ